MCNQCICGLSPPPPPLLQRSWKGGIMVSPCPSVRQDFVLFWLGIWYESIVWVIIGRQRVFLERRRSRCSSFGWLVGMDRIYLMHIQLLSIHLCTSPLSSWATKKKCLWYVHRSGLHNKNRVKTFYVCIFSISIILHVTRWPTDIFKANESSLHSSLK